MKTNALTPMLPVLQGHYRPGHTILLIVKHKSISYRHSTNVLKRHFALRFFHFLCKLA
jgi:hypothetical protein